MSFVTHLEAAIDGTRLEARCLQTLHAGRPLWVRYDLDAVRASVRKQDLATRERSLWRYCELLPLERDENRVSLGEGLTPLIDCPRLAQHFGLERLTVKDEALLPTGSFKSRGMAVAVSLAKELGVRRVAIPTAGNAGGALAAYAARAGMECFAFMPDDTPVVNRYEAALLGAHVFLVNGLIHECAAIVRAGVERLGWFDFSTLKEPYRIEGKKTMGLELAEQLDWQLPDVVLYPTGGGTGLIGMWKAWAELEQLGWIAPGRKPRLFSCQSDGCAPIARAFERGERFATAPPAPHTRASGLRVPVALGDFMILDAVRASGGAALDAPEDSIGRLQALAARLEGLALCPESALCLGVLERARAAGQIGAREHVVLFNTGAAQKYVELLEVALPRLDRTAVDWQLVAAAAGR